LARVKRLELSDPQAIRQGLTCTLKYVSMGDPSILDVIYSHFKRF
jgi:hypothetical protein